MLILEVFFPVWDVFVEYKTHVDFFHYDMILETNEEKLKNSNKIRHNP